MPTTRIRMSLFVVAVSALSMAPALGQTSAQRPTHIPTPQQPNSPFGTDWAKPGGTRGSYIYRDPRLRDPNSADPLPRGTSCPAPLLYDPTSGRCR